ncbi:MAG: hypothetical protein MR936_05170 [Eubacterium sp.]|nr:hypothetical protein [Eubacterium sp.]
MNNSKGKQIVENVVQAELRKGKLIKGRDVLLALPSLIDAVQIDKKRMRISLERCMKSKDPFNALLNAFGIQLIKKERIIDELIGSGESNEDVTVEIEDSLANRWITLKQDELVPAVEQIAQKLCELEEQANQDYDREKQRGDELFDKYEKLLKEYNELRYNSDTNERMIAERIQYLLFLGGKEAVSENEQLIELLRDLNIDVYWDCNDAVLTDSAMFTEYMVDDETMAGIKPCLVRNNSVYIKGMRLQKK